MKKYEKISYSKIAKEIFKSTGKIYTSGMCRRVMAGRQNNNLLKSYIEKIDMNEMIEINYKKLAIDISKKTGKLYDASQIKRIQSGVYKSKKVKELIDKILKA